MQYGLEYVDRYLVTLSPIQGPSSLVIRALGALYSVTPKLCVAPKGVPKLLL